MRLFMDYGHPEIFFFKSQTFGSGQTFWAETFWGILGIFNPFWYCKFFVHDFHYSTIISTKKTKIYSQLPIKYKGVGLNLGREEFEIKPSYVRSPCCPFNILQLMMTRLENQSIFEGHRAFICKWIAFFYVLRLTDSHGRKHLVHIYQTNFP